MTVFLHNRIDADFNIQFQDKPVPCKTYNARHVIIKTGIST